uniref:Uncharacterized protein n=1 Tax=Hemiselmis andersenii TaxID=464988 RepID=A0A6U5AVF1_HEMAN|mmetsp:Transcript_37291/g.87404  ORF Transcript_37291/g.87404 Transcript_37291/m.87404 type:complete len:137 (+) Transcript_37291:155-565(+)
MASNAIYQSKNGCCGEIPTDGPIPESLARAGLTPESWGQYLQEVDAARKKAFPFHAGCCCLSIFTMGLAVICWLPLSASAASKFQQELANIEAKHLRPLGITAYGKYTISDNGGGFTVYDPSPAMVAPQATNNMAA